MGRLFELVQSDWLFRMPSLRLAQEQAAAGGRVHLYELAWAPPGPLGACHALDVPLVLGTLGAGFGVLVFGDAVPDTAVALSQRARAAWTGFARPGDPGWPAYDPQAQQTWVIDVEPRVERYPEQASADYWDGFSFEPLPLLTHPNLNSPTGAPVGQ